MPSARASSTIEVDWWNLPHMSGCLTLTWKMWTGAPARLPAPAHQGFHPREPPLRRLPVLRAHDGHADLTAPHIGCHVDRVSRCLQPGEVLAQRGPVRIQGRRLAA